jgi:thiosulfate/3-mercaptopyruvate sulfurtransferase
MNLRLTTRRLGALALLAIPNLAPAADEKHVGSPLITQEKLQERLKDPKVRLLDARPRAEYDQGHIPGAVWVDTRAFQELSRAESIRDETAWARALAPLGISDETHVVFVYDSARQHDAARVWWSLSYAGVPRVGLVDGSFALWQRDHRPVSTENNEVARRDFRPHFVAEKLASRDEVQQTIKSGSAQVLDARSGEEYRGERQAKNSKAPAGHIPAARNLDGYSLVDADGRFIDKESLGKKLGDAGLAADRPVISYSQSGNRSSLVVFALERAGVQVRHYVPGLADWSRDEQARIVSGREPGK